MPSRPAARVLLPPVAGEGDEQVVALELVDRQRQGDLLAGGGRRRRRTAADLGWQVVDLDDLAGPQHDRPLDGVAQLAGVARPAVRGQRVEGGRRDAVDPAERAGQPGEEMPGEGRDARAALAQRRDDGASTDSR
jgi:hypothetical protein